MPLVKVEIVKGKSSEYKKTLLDCIHEALALYYLYPYQRHNFSPMILFYLYKITYAY